MWFWKLQDEIKKYYIVFCSVFC